MTIFKKTTATLFMMYLIGVATPVWSNESTFEYKVVILQGITAGGTLEKESSGILVDKKKTEALSLLAAEGWEILSVVGSGAGVTVYLRRQK